MFDKVGMPHVMWDLQGEMVPVYKKDGEHEVIERLELAKPGSVSLAEYDAMVGDLVNYLQWQGRYAESMHVVRELFRQGTCSFHGEYVHVDVPMIGPQLDDPPPLVASVGGPRTIREKVRGDWRGLRTSGRSVKRHITRCRPS